jgi:hypothetical protein
MTTFDDIDGVVVISDLWPFIFVDYIDRLILYNND